MSKISKDAARAFIRFEKFKRTNTAVVIQDCPASGRIAQLYLHNNLIAMRRESEPQRNSVTNAGWPTVTTRSRLNALPGIRATQRDADQYLNDAAWDGDWQSIDVGVAA